MVDYFKPLPVNHEKILEEERRSYDRIHTIDDKVISRSDNLINIVLAVYTIFATLWTFTGPPSSWYIVLIVLVTIGLVVVLIKLIMTSRIAIPDIHTEIRRYDDYELSDKGFQFWRLMKIISDATSELKKVHNYRSNWFDLTLIVLFVTVMVLVGSLFL